MKKIITHIFTLLYKLYWLFEYGNYQKKKIIPEKIYTKISTQIQMDTDENYYSLTQHIRNLKNLTEEEITFIQTLPNENLIELIFLYDTNSKCMNEYIMGL